MDKTHSNVEKLFFISIYKIYIQRYYVEKYRRKLLITQRCINSIVSCAPVVFLTLVMLFDEQRSIWLACASIASIAEAFSRFLPYNDKQEELLNVSRELDIILGQMNYCWDKYKLGLIEVVEFQRLSERYFDFFNLNLSNAGSETYKEEPRYKEYAIGKAAEQLKVITSCNIGALLSETRDKGK